MFIFYCVIWDIKITTDVVVDDSIATDIIIFNNDIKTLEEEMGIFISDDLSSNEADFSDDYWNPSDVSYQINLIHVFKNIIE